MIDIYDFPLFRPPSEANSIIIQATYGCSHNKCTFCGMYKMKKFSIRSIDEIRRDLIVLRAFQTSKKLFIADGNALCIPADMLTEIIEEAKKFFLRLKGFQFMQRQWIFWKKAVRSLKV